MAALLAACGVGERPRPVEPNAIGGQPGTPTGVDAVDAVLHLQGYEAPQLTATYTITTKFGSGNHRERWCATATGGRSPSATCAT